MLVPVHVNMALDYKEWLRTNREALVEHLQPRRTVAALVAVDPEGLDALDMENIFQKHTTSRDQSEALLDILATRGEEFCEAFRRVIQMTSPHLAAIVDPLRYQILWLAPTPQHAAMVVHVLERYAHAKFLPVEEGLECLVRRGAVFGERDVQVRLVFPVRTEAFPRVVSEVVQGSVDMAVLTGACDSLSDAASAGRVLVPTTACSEGQAVSCPGARRVDMLQGTLQGRLQRAEWQSGELRQLYRRHAYMDHQAVLLARLYLELQHVGRGEESAWLAGHGWVREEEEEGVWREGKRAMLSRLLPDWGTGRLASTLLRERKTWSVDTASPLGMAPGQDLLARVRERVDWCDQFPRVIASEAPTAPLFGSISHPGGDGLATDTDTYQFYQVCSSRLGQDRPWLACKCVCHDMESGSQELSAFSSVAMAMEIVQLLRTRNQ